MSTTDRSSIIVSFGLDLQGLTLLVVMMAQDLTL